MEVEGLVPNHISAAVSNRYKTYIFLCNELVTVFSNFCSEDSLTQGSGFVPIEKLNLFSTNIRSGFDFKILNNLDQLIKNQCFTL